MHAKKQTVGAQHKDTTHLSFCCHLSLINHVKQKPGGKGTALLRGFRTKRGLCRGPSALCRYDTACAEGRGR